LLLFILLQSASTNVVSGLADSTVGKLFGLFRSDKDKTLSSPLIIPVNNALRSDVVFPLVESSPCDTEVEVVHIRGVNKCRKRGRGMRGGKVNSERHSVEIVSGTGSHCSSESGYRSTADGAASTPVISSDVSNSSLASASSSTSQPVTSSSPCGLHSSCVTDQSQNPDDVPAEGPVQPLATSHAETSPIMTRTEAEDQLIRSILDDHCRTLCAANVHDSMSSMPLPVVGLKDPQINTDNPASLCERGLPSEPCGSLEERSEVKCDEMQGPCGEHSTEVTGTDSAELGCELLAADDEISIYDDGRLAAHHQQCAVSEHTTYVTSVILSKKLLQQVMSLILL